ncbi:glycosyltransferase [Kineococcus rhizosphaerae]|uniref:Glycosyl transferase family 1 n=1 Tax=Kineococcus rhizosphaerae TaxID=559628 RepID=A0A2T0R0Y6_9ACTN|nr:glycosyltransferase [Kineococcus rhizosphaerae]PRY12953.1 glycosyl transferase family 1 [Kineococcus rhizosphaerae]
MTTPDGARPLTIHLQPSPDRPMVNPYLSLLVGALREQGHDVVHLGTRPFDDRSVVHVHWPEMPLHSPRTGYALKRLARTYVHVLRARRAHVPVVWTLHNLRAHDGSRPLLQRLLWQTFPRLVDGWISLSATGVAQVEDAFPVLARAPHRVVAHGTYEPVLGRPDRAAARARLGLDAGHAVLAAVGRIKPYKGVEDLVAAVVASPDPSLRLVVAGGCDDPGLRRTLSELADHRVTLLLQELPQEGVDDVLAAADLTVLPFRSVFNSGSVLLCLSAGRPVLARRTAVFEELGAEVGPGWLRTFEGPLTPEVLHAALEARPRRGGPDLTRHRWETVARDHADFATGLLARRRAQPQARSLSTTSSERAR